MRRSIHLIGFLLLLMLVSACSALPGLRVLSGEEGAESVQDQVVQTIDLVMADKDGYTDPSLIAAIDRIEAAAAGTVDIIEARLDPETRVFTVDLLINMPPPDFSTIEGQVAYYDTIRHAVELTWLGTMYDSEGADVLSVTLLDPAQVATLDSGEGIIGIVNTSFSIDRPAAMSYLSQGRSLNGFYDMITAGTLTLTSPSTTELYDGEPNHPLSSLPAG
jgi:hypothetical protein